MASIIFKQLFLENVFSIKNAILSLDHKGIRLINGFSYDEGHSNGSGKSSLINKGLIWTLFGQTPGGIKGDDVINRWSEDKEAFGIVSFTKDKIKYRIERTRTKGKTSLKVLKQDKSISKEDVKGTQELINSLLGRDLKSFCNTEFFGQGNKAPFLSLTGREQKVLLESILPIDIINNWIQESKKARQVIDNKLKTYDKDVNYFKAKLEILKSDHMQALTQCSEWWANNKSSIKRLEEKIEELKSSDNIRRIEEIKAELTSKPQNLDQKIKNVTASLAQTNHFLTQFERYLNDANQSRVELERYLAAYRRGDCPTCEQPWPVNEEKLNQITSAISNIKQTIDTLNINITNQSEARTLSEEELRSLEKTYKYYYSLESELDKLKSENIEAKISQLNTELELLNKQANPHQERVNKISQEIKDNSVKYEKIKKDLDIINNEGKIIDFWTKTYDVTLRNAMFDKVCPYLEYKINKHLKGLHNSQIEVNVSTTKVLKSGDSRSDFVITVSSNTGGHSYDSLSGGEQQIVNFAVGLALADLADSQVSGSSNLLVLDEPFVALDEKNCENIVNYLNDLPKPSIFLISNEESLKSLIPNRIIVEKRNGQSIIRTGN